ncbi:MAG: 3-phosphoshikimate 1-carboxyvinyltransferase [Pseudomonadota bacterium]
MVWTSHPVPQIAGTLRAPGDKSCSHRALILGGLAEGRSEITGLLEGDDVRRTGAVMAALGATLKQKGDGHWIIDGVGENGLSQPTKSLDFGNSGTGVRLMMGVLAGYGIVTELVGDDSLSARPMRRVMTPLEEMGVSFGGSNNDKLPLTQTGCARLKAITYTPPQASAQVKSCILLAGLRADGLTIVHESHLTRDHSERMLRAFGVEVITAPQGHGQSVSIRGGQVPIARDTTVPGDPSSAAFLAAAALLSPRGGVLIERVMSNATRDGFFRVAAEMGAQIGAEAQDEEAAGERLVDMSFETSPLKGIQVPDAIVPSMIDEFPILAVLAAFATGETRVTGAAELRVKESDRIDAVVDMLRVNGVEAEGTADGFVVQGCGGPVPGGGLVETRHDHRIAMSALIMGTASRAPISVDDASMIATSYPDFFADMKELGADIREA